MLQKRIDIPAPPWADEAGLLESTARYIGIDGGRGGGKSHFVAEELIEAAILEPGISGVGLLVACVRQVQNTLAESSKRLIESKLMTFGLGEAEGFKVYEDCITAPKDGLFIFKGMQHYNAESIKSLEGYKRGWWEEAQSAQAVSLDIYRPTFRSGARMYFTWNPKLPPNPDRPTDSVDGLFGGHLKNLARRKLWLSQLPGGGVYCRNNFDNNPHLPPDLKMEEAFDREHRTPEDYAHIWKGAYQLRSEARVFQNWRVEHFDTPATGCAFLFGADFGYSVDPSVIMRCWIARREATGAYVPDSSGRFLMIDHEAYRVGCDVDFTPALFAGNAIAGPGNQWGNRNPLNFPGLPEAHRWPIIADSARPETISYCQRNGLPQMKGAKKGAGSVEDGIEFLKAFTIVIHPRCKHTADEFTFYSWKVDKNTGLVLPVLEDKKNHVIDSARYAVEDTRRARGFFG